MKTERKKIRPDYYDEFGCIAGQCPITCCQEWKIAVDVDTNRRWKKVLPPDTMPGCIIRLTEGGETALFLSRGCRKE